MIDQHKGLTSPDGITYRLVPLEWIIPNPENYNQHPREQIEALKADFKRFKQVKPYVVKQLSETQFMLSAGEGCTIAAAELLQEDAKRYEHLGWAKIIVVPNWWTDADVQGFMVADNATGRMSVPDEERLMHILQRQQEAGYDLRSLGSDEEALRQMLANLGDENVTQALPDGDDFELSPDEVVVRCKRGELWQLGEHRLLVDDSTKVENVKRLMQGKKAVLMATDPPYGDSWVQKAKDMQAHGYVHSRAGLHGSIESDDLNITDLKAFLITFLEAAKVAGNPPMPFYVWHRAKRIVFEQALIESGYFVHQPVVWVKPGFVIGRLHYHPRCEWALHGWRQGNGTCPFYGERNQSDVWEVGRENDKIHPTQKPLELFTIPILNHTKEGDICYEPFAGSGTQIISAERLGRRCYAMELDERYATVCLTRWEIETGQEARLLEHVEVPS